MVQLKIKREREKCEETLDTWRIERNLLKPRRKERSQIKPTTPHHTHSLTQTKISQKHTKSGILLITIKPLVK